MTYFEYLLCKELIKQGVTYVSRDRNGDLFAWADKPVKDKYGEWMSDADFESIHNDYLQEVTSEDTEPTLIQSLIDDYERDAFTNDGVNRLIVETLLNYRDIVKKQRGEYEYLSFYLSVAGNLQIFTFDKERHKNGVDQEVDLTIWNKKD